MTDTCCDNIPLHEFRDTRMCSYKSELLSLYSTSSPVHWNPFLSVERIRNRRLYNLHPLFCFVLRTSSIGCPEIFVLLCFVLFRIVLLSIFWWITLKFRSSLSRLISVITLKRPPSLQLLSCMNEKVHKRSNTLVPLFLPPDWILILMVK